MRSPIDGQVLLPWDAEQSLIHRPVVTGQRVMTIADPHGDWELELAMPERRMGHVREAVDEFGPELEVSYVSAADPRSPKTGNDQEGLRDHAGERGRGSHGQDDGRYQSGGPVQAESRARRSRPRSSADAARSDTAGSTRPLSGCRNTFSFNDVQVPRRFGTETNAAGSVSRHRQCLIVLESSRYERNGNPHSPRSCWRRPRLRSSPTGRGATAVKLSNFVVTLIYDVRVPAREPGVLIALDAKKGQVVEKDEFLGQIDDSDAQIRKLIAENELKVAETQAASDANLMAAEATIGVAEGGVRGVAEHRRPCPQRGQRIRSCGDRS